MKLNFLNKLFIVKAKCNFKNIAFYSLSFFALFIFILYLSFVMTNKSYKVNITRKILAEIGNESNNSKQFNQSTAPFVMGEFTAVAETGDGRVANLKNFFRKYNSPLYDSAHVIVEVSDKYKFDYRLIPAIAMQESNLCKYTPENSHNCWGWGIYGTTVTRFSSYDEAIETVAKGLKKEYLDKGLVTASDIMEKYTPSSNGSWAHGVNTFLKALQ